MSTPLELRRIRADFPALRREIDGRVPAFFDGPGGTQVPTPVIDAVAGYLAHHNANTHGAFATSRETDAVLDGARAAFADFVGAASPREIAFGANMTTLTFAVSRALGAGWEEGDELIVTELDHQANVAPWRRIAEDRGMTVRTLPLDPATGTLRMDRLEALITDRTRLLAIGAASNALGTVSDVARASATARAAGVLTYVDAVHYAPHRAVDVQRMGCDFLVCSAYKFFGPHVGVLWGREELLERFRPYKVPPSPDTAPERWESGTLNHEGIAGAAASVDWIAGLAPGAGGSGRREGLLAAWDAVRAHEGTLFRSMVEELTGLGVETFGPPADGDRTPTLAFRVPGRAPEEVAERLAAEGVFVWSGDFYAPSVIEALGLADRGGVVRAGLAAYSSPDDVERLVAGVRRLVAR